MFWFVGYLICMMVSSGIIGYLKVNEDLVEIAFMSIFWPVTLPSVVGKALRNKTPKEKPNVHFFR